MIGVSLGAIIRKGGLGMPALVSIISFLLFYILTTYGKKFAKEGVMDPWVGGMVVCTGFCTYRLNGNLHGRNGFGSDEFYCLGRMA